MHKIKAVILAAGAGTRMKSEVPKVLHKVLDRTMLDYVLEAAEEAGAQEVCIVVGHKGDMVVSHVEKTGRTNVVFAVQEQQLGTGHAVMQAGDFIGEEGQVLILFGDTPLIGGDTLASLVRTHQEEGNQATVLSTHVDDPTGYGRIIRGGDGTFVKSVEHKDANETERTSKEINSGMYCFEAKALGSALQKITPHNVQGEYYLPDTLAILKEAGGKVGAAPVECSDEVLGVNSRVQLAEATGILQKRINTCWMEAGVTILSPETTFIGKDVVFENDVTVYPGVWMEGKCFVGSGSVIGSHSRIEGTRIGRNNEIVQSVILDSSMGEGNHVGPFAYIRPNSTLGDRIKIGDFVEIKNAVIGDGTKVSHLTYIGDADVGKDINFGCGTVVVNYDGYHKHRSVIEDGAFIGCNTNLISPVHIEKNAYTAAGSTITMDVPENALGIARAKQTNKEGWVQKYKAINEKVENQEDSR
ncbi:bifunctional UDP-N-acetylglucosamine diphosphorylase/glucosamine-1-phosphate N-acetyltransferase GlmU [Anaerotalea alkaliphila]|uniref:Bifunctional protein GlmU n=1 Tax=Anaerotalea alkaliphila TaxID=2662126 RepID=A0A7X5KMH6_9FIRM|nr:bifunctional UDP-N-acetylglucosamine diphosphorylase/glucosamine-1-phosphate N-acetyltransferase GlmU [Anaerotalea alkaliphila]NDL66738.1 bifunctional UDP-N-acetylglucosamine diphosphorylase/glucosamine-1-phosphate N-acetyltransferase GlmU [Anaerotalea alkaliphila]